MALNELIEYFRPYGLITLLGFGKEGRSSYSFLRKHFPEKKLLVADIDHDLKNNLSDDILGDENLDFRLGRDYMKNLQKSQLIIASPGIALKKEALGDKLLTTQSDLFLKFFRHQVIGVTGTKGKSTTSSLIHHILEKAGKHSLLIGNIGLPPFNRLEKITTDSLIVFEMSAHQLSSNSYSPHIAVLLNLFSEHLDHFSSKESYFSAKMNITRYQTEDDFLIYNKDDELLGSYLKTFPANRRTFGFSMKKSKGRGLYLRDGKVIHSSGQEENQLFEISNIFKLKGKHNLSNLLAASCAAMASGLEAKQIKEAVESFTGLEHRLEYVGRFGEIDFYNDSIATVPEASIAAIRSLENINTLILGGFDRGLDYDQLKLELLHSEIMHIIYTGKAGKRMYMEFVQELKNKQNHFVEDFRGAVTLAIKVTKAGSICLLSPAAASYDQFSNFEERGRLFKKMAENA